MKHQQSVKPENGGARNIGLRFSLLAVAVAQTALSGLGSAVSTGQSGDFGDDSQGAEVLTRGPVHEAFAGVVTYNPEPGVIVEKAPPEAIEELPPGERPSGDNISWIPGYWGWDDERDDYLWVSGTWRTLPPGRQWTSGYWGPSGQGYQWTSGYWAGSQAKEVTYLPRPPLTVEAGPNIDAPSRNHAWTPGSWMWQQERYAWRPGYWAEGRANWDWIPASYVWTRRGYVYVDGYWDYSFDRRGVLYAPVYFQSGYYSRPGYSYSPVVAIGLVAMMEHLFLRPNYHHYYFGDYYDRKYRNGGYYSPYTYHSSRHGYDPIYSYRRWTHREDSDWERRYEASYDYRRDHDSARPPHTWADQKRLRLDTPESREQQQAIAFPFEEMAKQKDRPIRTERVSADERQKLTTMSREVGKTRELRRKNEENGSNAALGKDAGDIRPTRVKMPASPIVGKSPDRLSGKQAPPKPQRAAVAELGRESTNRKPNPEPKSGQTETKGQPEPREAKNKKEESVTRQGGAPASPKQKLQPERRASPPDRQQPEAKEPKREPRQEPQAIEQKRESRKEAKGPEPKREVRQEPQAKEPKREPQPKPQAKEPNREPREEPTRQQTKPQERAKPTTPDKPKADDNGSNQSSGKDRKK